MAILSRTQMPDAGPRTISVPKQRARCDPFASVCWADIDRPVTVAEVRSAMGA